MREIKFRAWDKDINQMFYSDDCFFCFQSGVLLERDGENGSWPDTDIVMQYTGLKDKNGKEIYEGDILEFVTYERELLEVYWYEETLGWQMKRIVGSGTMFIPNYTQYLEVIGNIYENPDLLK